MPLKKKGKLKLKANKTTKTTQKTFWKVMVIDDNPSVHDVTKFVLENFSFEGQPLEIISAYSRKEAEQMLPEHPDTAIILLDVVMEETDSGLRLIKYIREELKNHFVRIILRTGQPGQAPEKEVIINYDINDYKAKSELTDMKLFTTIISCLRAYQQLIHVERTTLENARMQHELELVEILQKTLFPKDLPDIPNLDLAYFFNSATETGGDWCGFITRVESYLFVMIGDVTGHGAAAAIITSAASTACAIAEYQHSHHKDYSSSIGYPRRGPDRRVLTPLSLLQLLNQAVYEAGSSEYWMTFFVGRIDLNTGVMTFSNAGHNFPIILREGQTKFLMNANAHLGYRKEWRFTEEQIQLQENDLLFFYTDGLVDQPDKKGDDGTPWGTRRLIRSLKSSSPLSAKSVIQTVQRDAFHYYDNLPLEDDITMVACHVNAPFPQKNKNNISVKE